MSLLDDKAQGDRWSSLLTVALVAFLICGIVAALFLSADLIAEASTVMDTEGNPR